MLESEYGGNDTIAFNHISYLDTFFESKGGNDGLTDGVAAKETESSTLSVDVDASGEDTIAATATIA